MVKAVAVDPSSGVSAVVVEQDGTVRNRLRPSDLAFKANDVDYAVDVYRTCYYGTTAQNTPLEELFAKEDQENVKRYRAACEDQEINFFTFGIDAMGRLSESALSSCDRSPTAWRTRRADTRLSSTTGPGVSSLPLWRLRSMRLLLASQKDRDPCFSYVSEAALHLDNCDAHMPGGPSCDGASNRGLRRDAAAFPTSRLSV